MAHVGYLRDGDGRFRGVLSRETADLLPDAGPVSGDTPLHTLLRRVATAPCPLPVIDGDGCFLGAISRAALLETLDRGSLGDG